jgi:hypothetical protein
MKLRLHAGGNGVVDRDGIYQKRSNIVTFCPCANASEPEPCAAEHPACYLCSAAMDNIDSLCWVQHPQVT